MQVCVSKSIKTILKKIARKSTYEIQDFNNFKLTQSEVASSFLGKIGTPDAAINKKGHPDISLSQDPLGMVADRLIMCGFNRKDDRRKVANFLRMLTSFWPASSDAGKLASISCVRGNPGCPGYEEAKCIYNILRRWQRRVEQVAMCN